MVYIYGIKQNIMKGDNQPIKWTRNDKIESIGFLLIILPNITNDRVKELFGKLPKGVHNTSKYSEQITITNSIESIVLPSENDFLGDSASGIYSLYTSYGEWRIGGVNGNKHVDDLVNYIYGFNITNSTKVN